MRSCASLNAFQATDSNGRHQALFTYVSPPQCVAKVQGDCEVSDTSVVSSQCHIATTPERYCISASGDVLVYLLLVWELHACGVIAPTSLQLIV